MVKKNKKNSSKNLEITKSAFVLILLVFSFSLSSCGGNNRPEPINVYTGTEGITIKFTQNNPPMEVYEGSEVILMAEIWNKGAFTPIPGNHSPVYIAVNTDELYFKFIRGSSLVNENSNGVISLPTLAGKSQEWPTGEKTILPVALLNVSKIPGTRESPTTKIEVSACYQYTTYFSENICVDSDIYDIDPDPVCRNQRTYNYAGQGAPVIVSRIDVDMIPVGVEAEMERVSVPVVDESGQLQEIGHGQSSGKSIIVEPNFRIYFKNTDKGVVLNTANANDNPCVTGSTSKGTALRVKASLSDLELECADADINMYSNEASVRCWLPRERVPTDFELNRNFELPLNVEAEYFYRTSYAKDIKIIRVI